MPIAQVAVRVAGHLGRWFDKLADLHEPFVAVGPVGHAQIADSQADASASRDRYR
jgi:hypothetical protein